MSIWDVFSGLYVSAWCFLPLYGALLSVNYMAERDKDRDITYFQYVMLLLCTVSFTVLASRADFKLLKNVLCIVAFAVFSVLWLITLVRLGMSMYSKAHKGRGVSLGVAALAAAYILLLVFSSDSGDSAKVVEPEYPDPEDYISENATDDYHDGFIDGFGDGYSAAYKELTGDYP